MHKRPTIPEKIRELIDMYYLWREENKGGGASEILNKCESINNLWDIWIKKHHKGQYEELKDRYRHYMDLLTQCYTAKKEKEAKELLRQELRNSLTHANKSRVSSQS